MSISSQLYTPFSQMSDIVDKLDKSVHTELLDIVNKFGGLCDIISNVILMDPLPKSEMGLLKNSITVQTLDDPSLISSHMFKVYSKQEICLAILYKVYPDNLFSHDEQLVLVTNENRVNKKVLEKGLDTLQIGETVKLTVFKTKDTSFAGHSILIKKISNSSYTIFDSNDGEHRDLAFRRVAEKINRLLEQWDGDIYITRGDDCLARLRSAGIAIPPHS